MLSLQQVLTAILVYLGQFQDKLFSPLMLTMFTSLYGTNQHIEAWLVSATLYDCVV